MTDIHTGHLELENDDDEQTNFANELKNLDKSPKSVKKKSFTKQVSKPAPKPTKRQTSQLKLLKKVKNENITAEKHIYEEIF